MTTVIKWIAIILLVVLIILFVFFGSALGFPWEKIIASDAARKYVIETYGLTPIKTRAHFFAGGANGVYVTTEELPFDFDVAISRNNLKPLDNDNYLECLVEYKLSQAIAEDMQFLLDENCTVQVRSFISLTRRSPKGLSIDMVNENPKEVFEKLSGDYYVAFYHRNVLKNGFDLDTLDYENEYKIIKTLLKKWDPSSVYISYTAGEKEGGGVLAEASVDKDDFDEINSYEDLKGYYMLPTAE